MQKVHLNYGGNQDNGIVFNTAYPWGAMFRGEDRRPVMSFQFDSFQYSEVFETPNTVIVNTRPRPMTPAEEAEVKAKAEAWVQLPNEEGGTQWLIERAQREALNQRVATVCRAALEMDGFTAEEVALFFPGA